MSEKRKSSGRLPLSWLFDVQLPDDGRRVRIPAMWEEEQYSGHHDDPYTIPLSDRLWVRPELQYGVYSDGRGVYADPQKTLYKGLSIGGRF